MGGPIVRDKTFFWFSTESYRTNEVANTVLHLPTQAEARGDFSQSGVTIHDPLTTRPDPDNPGQFVRDPCPGNVIPPDRLNPVGLNLAAALASRGSGDVSANGDTVNTANQFSVNVSHELSQNHTLTATYMYYDSLEPPPQFHIGGPSDPGVWDLYRQVHLAALNDTILVGNDGVVTLRYGYNSFDNDFRSPDFDVRDFGWSENYASQVSAGVFPAIDVLGYGWGNAVSGGFRTDSTFYSHNANLGFILGPAIAGLLGSTAWGELLPVLAALGISFLATLIIAFKLPESSPCRLERDPEQLNVRRIFGQEQKPCFEIQDADKLGMRDVLRLDKVTPLLAVYFLVMMGFNFYYVSFPVYAAGGLQWSVRDVGVYFSVLSLSMVIVQGPILNRASRKSSDTTLAAVGSLILAAGFAFFVSRQVGMLYLGAVLLALGNGLMWPSIVSMLSKAAGARHQGVVQGFASSAGAVASIVGLVAGGILYASLGARVFWVSSLIILGVFLISLWLSSHPPRAVTA